MGLYCSFNDCYSLKYIGINCLLEYLQVLATTLVSLLFIYSIWSLLTVKLQIFPDVCLFTFWKHNNFGRLILTYGFIRKNSWCAPQGLIIGTPISQYGSCSAVFCPLQSNISKGQHEKHFCNPSSNYRKYKEYIREMHAPYLDAWKP